MGETSSGLKENLAGLLCYTLGPITGFLFFLTERRSKFVRFHSLQAIFFSAAWTISLVVIGGIFFFLPVLLKIFIAFVNLGGVVFWIALMVKSYQGEYFLLPLLGKIALENAEIK